MGKLTFAGETIDVSHLEEKTRDPHPDLGADDAGIEVVTVFADPACAGLSCAKYKHGPLHVEALDVTGAPVARDWTDARYQSGLVLSRQPGQEQPKKEPQFLVLTFHVAFLKSSQN
jgi:hypothetical protein